MSWCGISDKKQLELMAIFQFALAQYIFHVLVISFRCSISMGGIDDAFFELAPDSVVDCSCLHNLY